MSLKRFVKDLRKPPLPSLPVHYHMSVTTSPTSLPSLSIHSGTHITHYIYIDIHRYLPFPVLLAHTDVGESPSLVESPPPHIHTGPILPGAISVFSQHWRLLHMHCEPRWIKKVLPC